MKKIVAILAFLLVAIVSIFLLLGGCDKLGWGGGGSGGGEGDGEGSSRGNGTSASASASGTNDSSDKKESSTASDASSKPEKIKAEITVSGRDYLYKNNKITLDELSAELKKLGTDTEITIIADDTAAKNTVDDLTDRLDADGFANYTKK